MNKDYQSIGRVVRGDIRTIIDHPSKTPVQIGIVHNDSQIELVVLNAEGKEVASVVLEAWKGNVQVRCYQAGIDYSAYETEITHLARVEWLRGNGGRR